MLDSLWKKIQHSNIYVACIEYNKVALIMEKLKLNIEQSIRDHTLKSLIDSGTKGHFPLFHPDWMENVYRSSANNVSRVEQRIAKKILLMLSKHRSLARKQIRRLLPSEQMEPRR